jgi:hypothetical protein
MRILRDPLLRHHTRIEMSRTVQGFPSTGRYCNTVLIRCRYVIRTVRLLMLAGSLFAYSHLTDSPHLNYSFHADSVLWIAKFFMIPLREQRSIQVVSYSEVKQSSK